MLSLLINTDKRLFIESKTIRNETTRADECCKLKLKKQKHPAELF